MDISLHINADFQKAQAAFNSLADSSEETRKKIEKYAESFEQKTIDNFIDRQKLLTISMTGTRGETEALKISVNKYSSEMERLIRQGLEPAHPAIQRLKDEQEKLINKINENNEATKRLKEEQEKHNEVIKKNEELLKNAEKAMAGAFAIIGAGITSLAMLTQETAKMADGFAKAGRSIGISAEKYQELNYLFKQNGIKDTDSYLQKLNKSLIDVKNGTGNLTKYLQENNKELLNQLKNIDNTDDAFMLLMQEINNCGDSFSQAELSMLAFGKSSQELLNIASKGTAGIQAYRDEIRNIGLISNETAENSENLIDAQTKFKQSLQQVGVEITEKFIPSATIILNKITEIISSVDDWDKILRIVTSTIAGVTSSMVAFTLTMKIVPVIQGVTKAIQAAGGAFELLKLKILSVNAALAANPIGLLATGIAAGVGIIIGVLTNAITKQNEHTNSLNNNTSAMRRNASAAAELSLQNSKILQFEHTASYNNINDLLVARTNNYRELIRLQEIIRERNLDADSSQSIQARGYIERIDVIENRLRALATLQGQVFNPETNRVENAVNTDVTTQNLPNTISQNTITQNNEQKTLLEKLNNDIINSDYILNNERIEIAKNFLNQRAELEKLSGDDRIAFLENERDRLLNTENYNNDERIAIEQAVQDSIFEIREKAKLSFEEQLKSIPLTEEMVNNQRIEMVTDFLQQRLELETQNLENEDEILQTKLNYILQYRDDMLSLYEEGSIERIAIEEALNNELQRIQKEQYNFEKNLIEKKQSMYLELGSNIGKFFDAVGQHSRGAALFGRAIAIAEAAINTSLAVTKALSSAAPPFNFIQAGIVATAGAAQVAQIVSTMIPSKETGGRFIVPQSRNVDDKLFRFNGGEEVEVKTRGMTGINNESFNFNFMFNENVFASIINKLARSGSLYTLQLSGY